MDPLQTSTPTATEPKSFGALVGIVIVLVVIVAGGAYFWMQRPGDVQSESGTATTQELPPLSESDEVDSIESDLSATAISDEDFSSLESELNAQ